jgi:hypothetical protein
MSTTTSRMPRLTKRRRRTLLAASVLVLLAAVMAMAPGGENESPTDATEALDTTGRSAETEAIFMLSVSDTTTTAPATTTTTAPPPTTTTTTSAPATTSEPDTGPVAAMSGQRQADPAAAARPALAVKVDNSGPALPQKGLPLADIVIEKIIEGDTTRLIAVFQSKMPGQVGPVRSARTTDVHLLPQFGTTILAFSGANDGVIKVVEDHPAIVDLGPGLAGHAYSRDLSRPFPHNLFVETGDLWDMAPAGLPSPDPIFSFGVDGRANPPSARPASGVDISWGPGSSSPVTWRWDPALRLYLRTQAGRPHTDVSGSRLTAQNVVVLLTPYGQSPADTRSPEALSVGSGDALVFTNGAVVPGRWDRPSENVPAALTDTAGRTIELTPGQTWMQLPRPGGATIID